MLSRSCTSFSMLVTRVLTSRVPCPCARLLCLTSQSRRRCPRQLPAASAGPSQATARTSCWAATPSHTGVCTPCITAIMCVSSARLHPTKESHAAGSRRLHYVAWLLLALLAPAAINAQRVGAPVCTTVSSKTCASIRMQVRHCRHVGCCFGVGQVNVGLIPVVSWVSVRIDVDPRVARTQTRAEGVGGAAGAHGVRHEVRQRAHRQAVRRVRHLAVHAEGRPYGGSGSRQGGMRSGGWLLLVRMQGRFAYQVVNA